MDAGVAALRLALADDDVAHRLFRHHDDAERGQEERAAPMRQHRSGLTTTTD
jgi:hypothetical protein